MQNTTSECRSDTNDDALAREGSKNVGLPSANPEDLQPHSSAFAKD